jgi:hypothetical protein
MSQENDFSRQEHLLKFEAFCGGLLDAVQKAGLGPEEARAAIRDHVSARCVACAMPVSGEELLALAQPATAENPNPKVERLRKGDCARQGCDSFYYRVTFRKHPRLDWEKLAEQAPQGMVEAAVEPAAAPSVASLPRFAWNGATVLRIGLALAGVILVLVARQYYYGGRIWLIREPEHFKVSPEAEQPALRAAEDHDN